MRATSHLLKVMWTYAMVMLSIMWKSYISDKIKQGFFQAVAISILLHGYTIWTQTNHIEKNSIRTTKNAGRCSEQVPEATSHKTAAVWPPTSYHTNHSSKTNKAYEVQLEKQGGTHKRRSLIGSYTLLALHQRLIYKLCADTGYSLDDLPGVLDDRDRRRERKRERERGGSSRCQYDLMMMMMMVMIMY